MFSADRSFRILFALLLVTQVLGPDIGFADDEMVDEEYQKLLNENPEYRLEIEEVESALAGDAELGEEYYALQESISADTELAEENRLYLEALEDDSVLANREEDLEDAVAMESGAAEELVAYDSLLGVDGEFAACMEDVERVTGENEEFPSAYGNQIAWLQTNPEEAEEFFADESGPTYTDSEPGMIVFVNYLMVNPPVYRAYWRLYRHLRIHPAVSKRVYAHWRWLSPRPRLRWALLRYHHRAARVAGIHKIFWKRRLLIARRPWLSRRVWRCRAAVAKHPTLRPALRRHRLFLAKHHTIRRGVLHHRKWVKKHHPPHPVKRAVFRPKPAGPKVKTKAIVHPKRNVPPKGKVKPKPPPKPRR